MYVETNYVADKSEIAVEENLEQYVASSILHPAVAHLMSFIFNVNTMKQLFLEYSVCILSTFYLVIVDSSTMLQLDMKKMPLGKLSKGQIQTAYRILTDAIKIMRNKNKSQDDIVEITNQFYTNFPYGSAHKTPPLLDNMDIIKVS